MAGKQITEEQQIQIRRAASELADYLTNSIIHEYQDRSGYNVFVGERVFTIQPREWAQAGGLKKENGAEEIQRRIKFAKEIFNFLQD